MIKLWLFFLILTSASWKPEAIPLITEPEYRFHAGRCRNGAHACYYDSVVYVDIERAMGCNDLRHAVFHETQHHMQVRYKIWRTDGGWDSFMAIAEDLVNSGRLDEWQENAIKPYLGMTSSQHELHAELPWILHGELPPQFADWYPWLQAED